MLASLPGVVRIPLVLLSLVLHTTTHLLALFLFTLLKLLMPARALRDTCSRALVVIAESWIGTNSALFEIFTHTTWHVDGLDGLHRRGNYLVLCNHQSWVDIPVLQKIFNRRIPFLRFFLKSQLIWVPLLGMAWWALDFPFMKRYSKETLARHPELQGKDRESTRKACEKFSHMPVSVMNFAEGTRYTQGKHDAQKSEYRHLLRPRAGGVAFVLDAMDEGLHAILDVTIVYPNRPGSMMDLIAGRVRDIRVLVRERPISGELRGDYENDAAFREKFQAWINRLWRDKDAVIDDMLAEANIPHTGI